MRLVAFPAARAPYLSLLKPAAEAWQWKHDPIALRDRGRSSCVKQAVVLVARLDQSLYSIWHNAVDLRDCPLHIATLRVLPRPVPAAGTARPRR